MFIGNKTRNIRPVSQLFQGRIVGISVQMLLPPTSLAILTSTCRVLIVRYRSFDVAFSPRRCARKNVIFCCLQYLTCQDGVILQK
jgi:hypothetical protein